MATELEWDLSILDYEFKEDEQWGDPPTIPSSVDDKHRIALQNHSYFRCQDGNSTNDVINQCIFAIHSSSSAYEFDNTTFYDAYDTETWMPLHRHRPLPLKLLLYVKPDFQIYGPYLAGFLLI
jgi:hypothetical protein